MKTISIRSGSLLAVVIAVLALTSFARADDCPNKFDKRDDIIGQADDKATAEKKHDEALADQIKQEEAKCTDKKCTETDEICRFLSTHTKRECKEIKPNPLGKWVCQSKLRPGCFCLEKEEVIKLMESPAASKKGE